MKNEKLNRGWWFKKLNESNFIFKLLCKGEDENFSPKVVKSEYKVCVKVYVYLSLNIFIYFIKCIEFGV